MLMHIEGTNMYIFDTFPVFRSPAFGDEVCKHNSITTLPSI